MVKGKCFHASWDSALCRSWISMVMRNGGGWSSGQQFSGEVDAAEIHSDGGCSSSENHLGKCDEAGYIHDIDGGDREVVEGME